MEIWKLINGFDNYYVSNYGRFKKNNIILKQYKDKDNYMLIFLTRTNGKRQLFRSHRIVLSTFVGSCPYEMECRHLDGNPSNNKLDNLKWGTISENRYDQKIHGTDLSGSRNGRAILNEQQVKKIKQLLNNGESTTKIAKSFKVKDPVIYKIKVGINWRHI